MGSIFAPVDCWMAVKSNTRDDWKALTYTANNCLCESLIIVIYLITLVITTVVSAFYIKTYYNRKNIFKARNFYILLFMFMLSGFQAIHFLIKIP